MSFFVKLHKYYMFDDYFQKYIVSCGHSLILMYYTLIWFNCKKNLKFRNGSKKWPNFGIKESKYDIAYRNFFNVKTHLNHQFDLKYERSCLNHYGSSPHMLCVSKECASNMREIYSIFYHSLSTGNYSIMKFFTISRLHMLFIKF